MNPADTVVAISSAAGPAARGIVRLTGTDALAAAGQVVSGLPVFPPRGRYKISLLLPGWPAVGAFALIFRAPHSYTGDDLVELHLPGCATLLESTVAALIDATAGVRPAGPGEFTWRAVLNGRLDATQAEAVGELVSAPDAVAASRCVAGLLAPAASETDHQSGGATLAARVRQWREELGGMLARAELALDFSDDEDLIYVADPPALRATTERLHTDVSQVAAGNAQSQAVRADLPDVVLAGPANAGKSSLFNRLLGDGNSSARAMVTRHAGTTRDAVSAELNDPPLRLWDTAGLAHATVDAGSIEQRAEGLSLALASACDLLLWCWPADAPEFWPPPMPAGSRVVWRALQTRADLRGTWSAAQVNALPVSSRTGQGLDALRDTLRETVANLQPAADGVFANARQAAHLTAAAHALAAAIPLAGDARTLELASLHLGEADRELAAVLGVEPATGVASEAILQRIFAGFCVGK